MPAGPDEPSGASSAPGGGSPRRTSLLPEWLRRIAETANNVINLERTVSQLQFDNLEIKRDIADIRRDQEVQAKQIEMLSDFIRDALNERIELKAENAAYRILTSIQGPRKSDETGEK